MAASRYLVNPKQQSAEERGHARFALNLQCAFGDLASKLERAYAQPARDAADARKQHEDALIAVANFLEQMAPDRLSRAADRLAMLAQSLRDLNEGVRAPAFIRAAPSRGDPGMVWIARAAVVRAVDTIRGSGLSREEAAKWVAKRHPGLKKLITESGPKRSKSIERAIISWCKDFSGGKVKNPTAREIYSIGCGKLAAWAPNRNDAQREGEADRLLKEALRLCSELSTAPDHSAE
jgi:hypothetical protein